MKQIIKEFKQALETDNKTKPYDTAAKVVRVENGTAWVHIPGGVDETPVKLTMDAKEGDNVQVRVSGGRAWLTGNATAPPTDDATAKKAQSTATEAKQLSDIAYNAAENAVDSAGRAATAAASAQSSAQTAYNAATNAQTSANNALASAQNASEYAARALGNLSTVQSVAETLTWITQHGTMTLTSDVALDPTHVYFVQNDATGYYTVGAHKYDIVTEPDIDDIGTYYVLTIDESLNNYVGTHLALTQEGLWLLPASSGTNRVLIATGAGSTYTTAGTYILNSSGGVEASFRSNGATIGQILNGYSRTEIGTDGMQIYQRDSGNNKQIAHLGYGEGATSSGTANAPYFSLGTRATTSTAYSSSSTYKIGDLCVYNNKVYACITPITTAEAWNSSHWQLAIGTNSISEGGGSNLASGGSSHAEGGGARALGHCSHAEGMSAPGYEYTIANGEASHAEGCATQALGRFSHAEGSHTKASGNTSHAQGTNTIAGSTAQTALGKYNVADNADTYAVIVGNGTADNARSNALTVDWSGNVNIPTGANYCINNVPISGGGGGGDVTGVKGNAEVSYRTGNVNLTPANIGAIDTAGTGLTKSSTTLNHSNSITAQTTQAVYPIKIDAQGHISAYGSAVTIPTVNNATLTIQKNSSTVATFTANASSAVTADISVPTDTSDLTNGAGFITSGDIPAIHNVPSGGTSGQVLTKNSNTDYDLTWTTPGGGGGVTLPIGAVYESINSTNPSSDLGNTWTYIGTADMNGISLVTSDGDGIITSDGEELESVRATYKFARTA